MERADARIAAETVAESLRLILRGVLSVFGAWRAMAPELGCVFYNRISLAQRRLERLWGRFCAGTLRARVAPWAGCAACGVRRPGVRMPRQAGWLLAAGRHEAAYFTQRLTVLLQEPEMRAFLAASPQAVRLLRPVCRALAVESDLVRPCGALLVARAAAVGVVRVRKPRVKVDLGRVPLPRGVISWARRERGLEKLGG